jgi:hypothetical protein
MHLSWNERRKMKQYEKQVQKDTLKRGKAEERERRREETVLAKQWKDYYKCVSYALSPILLCSDKARGLIHDRRQQEKETKKWRKATTHHPELNYPSTPLPSEGAHHHHGIHLHSPHISHQQATRPLPTPFHANSGAYTAQYLPVNGPLGSPAHVQQAPMLPSLAAFGVVDTGVRADGSAMSR